MNEDVSPIRNGDFPASHVSFLGSSHNFFTIEKDPLGLVNHKCLPLDPPKNPLEKRKVSSALKIWVKKDP